jgi:hypothetical protein
MKISGRIPPALWLAGIAAIGLVLIVLPASWPWWSVRDFGVTRDVGIAVLSASILGFTIDRWLKAEIVSNVFEAAMGYVLPKEFRQEIQNIIGYKFICESHLMIVHIKEIDDGLVKVATSIERASRNISAFPESRTALAHIDEWGFKEKSQILECQITVEGHEPVRYRSTKSHQDMSVSAETESVIVAPGQIVKVLLKYTETKRTNDEISWIFLAPTLSPVIEVQISPILDYICRFGTPAERIEVSEIANRHRLIGTYFPGQRMRVRWWPRDAGEVVV